MVIVIIWIKFVSMYSVVLYHNHNLVCCVRKVCCSLLKMKEYRVEVKGDRCKNLLSKASNVDLLSVDHYEGLIVRWVLCDTSVNGSSLTHDFTFACLWLLLSDSEISHTSNFRWNQLNQFFYLFIEVVCFDSFSSLWKLVCLWDTIYKTIHSENGENTIY